MHPQAPLHTGSGGGPLRARGTGPPGAAPPRRTALAWPRPSRQRQRRRAHPPRPSHARHCHRCAGPRLPAGPQGDRILSGMRGARGQKPDSCSPENDSDSSRSRGHSGEASRAAQGPSAGSQLHRLGSNWRTQKPLLNERRKIPREAPGETAAPIIPPHTHMHARRTRALQSDSKLPGRAGTPQGGTEQDARLRVLPAPPPVHAQHCRRGPRPSAQPLLSGGCVPPPAARREGLGKQREGDLSRRPQRLQRRSECARAGHRRRACSARRLKQTAHRNTAADGPSSDTALGVNYRSSRGTCGGGR